MWGVTDGVQCVSCCVLVAPAVPGRRLWLLSFHNFISTYYAPLLFRPLAYLRGLRNLFGEWGPHQLAGLLACVTWHGVICAAGLGGSSASFERYAGTMAGALACKAT